MRRLTPGQQRAIEHLASDPEATVDEMVDAAGIRGWDDNRAMFVLRLLRTGAVRLVVRDGEE